MTDQTTRSRFVPVATFALVALLAVGVAGFTLAGGVGAQSASNFAVTIDSTNSPVQEGETLEVTATVENTGDYSDTQDITLTVGGKQRDMTQVALEPGEQRTVTLDWATSSGDAGEYTANVSSDDDFDTTAVSVDGPSYFQVDINSTNSPVTENDTVAVEAIIENTGDQTDNQKINLSIDGKVVDNATVALDPGASQSRTLNWQTESGDAGDHQASVESEDDADDAIVTVENVPEFEVDIQSTNEPVAAGQTLQVDVEIDNNDRNSDTQDVELEIDGTVRDTESVALDGGESSTVQLDWETETGDSGQYRANVSSETDSDSVEVLVNEPPSAAFTRDPARPNVNEAVTFEADASDPDGTVESYEWTVDGESVSGAREFTYTFSASGDHDVTLTVTDDDGGSTTASRTIAVNAPPSVEIDPADTRAGEEVTVEADATDPDGSIARYEWRVDGEAASTADTLNYTFSDPGAHQITVEVEDDYGATAVTTATINVEGDGTATRADNGTTTDTATGTESPTSQDGPGFGAAVALLAVLATALIARREA
jgi:PGF-CTERM protein